MSTQDVVPNPLSSPNKKMENSSTSYVQMDDAVDVAVEVKRLAATIQQLKTDGKNENTAADDGNLHTRMQANHDVATRLAKSIAAHFKANPPDNFGEREVSKHYVSLVAQLKGLQGDSMNRRQSRAASMHYEVAPPIFGGGGDELAGLGFKTQEVAEIDQAELQARQQGVEKLAQQTSEVAELFKDVSELVDDQGREIDTVEANTESANHATAAGVGHLSKAEANQKALMRKYKFLLVLVVAICGLVGIVVAVSAAKK